MMIKPENMYNYIKFTRGFLIFCAFVVPQSFAYAADIVNLADVPKQIEIKTSEGYRQVTIEPGRKFTRSGDLYVRFEGKQRFIEFFEEYAIWPDGTFGPQRRIFNPASGN